MTHGVDALQKHITQDVKGHASTGLHASVGHAVAGIGEAQILLLQRELLVPHGKTDDRELVDGGVGRVNVSLLSRIILAPWDRLVDGLASFVVNKSEGGSGISDGGVAGSCNRLARYNCRGTIKHPEALRVVHRRVVRGLAAKGVLVNVAEGIEGFAFVGIVHVFIGAKVGGKELGCLWDVVLRDHVLDGSLHRVGSDSIDGSPGETKEPVAAVLLKLSRESFSQFDGLILNDETAHVDDIRSH